MRKNPGWFRRDFVPVAGLGLVLVIAALLGDVAWGCLAVILLCAGRLLMLSGNLKRSKRIVVASMADPLVRLDYQYSPKESWACLWRANGRTIVASFTLLILCVVLWSSDLMDLHQGNVIGGFLLCTYVLLFIIWMRAQYRRRNDTELCLRGVFTMSAEGFVPCEHCSEKSAVPWTSMSYIRVVDDAVYFRWFLGTSVIHPAAFATPEDREAFLLKATDAWHQARARKA